MVSGCNAHPAAKELSHPEGIRIVSLAPSTTEALYALGLGNQVVGVSRYCDYPPQAQQLPNVGGFTDPSLEAILALRPTWVIGARSPSNRGIVTKLNEQKIHTWFPVVESVSDVKALLRDIGAKTGHQKEADFLISGMDDDLQAMSKRYRNRTQPHVLLAFSEEPLSVAGPQSLGDAMLLHAQARNVMQAGPRYPILSIEQVLKLAPEIIIIARHSKANATKTVIDWKRYTTIPAVKHGRVHILRDDRLLRPGPRITQGIRALAQTIHGD